MSMSDTEAPAYTRGDVELRYVMKGTRESDELVTHSADCDGSKISRISGCASRNRRDRSRLSLLVL